LFTYPAKITSIIDGDTVKAQIDTGFGNNRAKETLRFSRINAPEKRGSTKELGLASKKYLQDLIYRKRVVIRTVYKFNKREQKYNERTGKYGRYLAEICLWNEDNTLTNINDLMVEAGHAVYKDY
jgi:micrococcal nuclease